MQDRNRRKHGPESLQKAFPCPSALLAPSPELTQPQPLYVLAKRLQSLLVVRNCVILEVPANHGGQPLPYVPRRRVHLLPQLRMYILQPPGHAFAHRLAIHREVPGLAAPPTDVSQPQKVEGLWFPFSTLCPSLGSITPKLDQARLIRMYLQSEFAPAAFQLPQKSLCVIPVLNPKHGVVGVADDDHLASRNLLPPCHHP